MPKKVYPRCDIDGLLVCTYIKSDSGKWVLTLEPGFVLVESQGGLGIWDTVKHKMVEFGNGKPNGC